MRRTCQLLALGLALNWSGLARADEAPALKPGEKIVEETIPNPPKKWGYAFLGAGAPLLLLGVILGGAAAGKASEQNGDPKMPPIYTTGLRDSALTGQSLANAGYTFMALGAALLLVDVVVWFEVLRKPRTNKRTVQAGLDVAPGRRVAQTTKVSPTLGGMLVQW